MNDWKVKLKPFRGLQYYSDRNLLPELFGVESDAYIFTLLNINGLINEGHTGHSDKLTANRHCIHGCQLTYQLLGFFCLQVTLSKLQISGNFIS